MFISFQQQQKRTMTICEYRDLAFCARYQPNNVSENDLEYEFWNKISDGLAPIYGTDIYGSFFDQNSNVWNINKLDTILNHVRTDYDLKIDNLTTSALFFGMWKAAFMWHTEDMDLYSISYIHFGAPKKWYVIPAEDGAKFESLISQLLPKNYEKCKAHLRRHKLTMVNPAILKKNNVRYFETTQYAREIIITFPSAFHAGFNHGFNCAEVATFASESWIDFGKCAMQCTCARNINIKFPMDAFVQRYQAERYQNYLNGSDFVEYYQKPAPKPSIEDFLLNRNNKVITDSMIRMLIDRPKRITSALEVDYDDVRSACLLYAYGNYKEAAKYVNRYLENNRKDSQAPILYYLLAECNRHSTTKKNTNTRTNESYRKTIGLLLDEREENLMGVESKNEKKNLMERKQYTCNICGYTSYKSSSMVDHMDVHEKLNDRKCKICDKQFDKRRLRLHIMYYIRSTHPSNGPHSKISKEEHEKYHAYILQDST